MRLNSHIEPKFLFKPIQIEELDLYDVQQLIYINGLGLGSSIEANLKS